MFYAEILTTMISRTFCILWKNTPFFIFLLIFLFLKLSIWNLEKSFSLEEIISIIKWFWVWWKYDKTMWILESFFLSSGMYLNLCFSIISSIWLYCVNEDVKHNPNKLNCKYKNTMSCQPNSYFKKNWKGIKKTSIINSKWCIKNNILILNYYQWLHYR